MIAAEPWTPLCMSEDDWRGWQAKNSPDLVAGNVAAHPCTRDRSVRPEHWDCPLSWREGRKAVGLCNDPDEAPGQVGLDLFSAA